MVREGRVLRYPPCRTILLMLYVIFCVIIVEMTDIPACSIATAHLSRLFGYAWRTATMDPGILDKNEVPSDSTTSCPSCGANRREEDKVHHCRVCGYCVLQFDHHCGVLGVCIGKYNFGSFLALVVFGALGHAILGHVASCAGTPLLSSLYIIYVDSLLLHWPPHLSSAITAVRSNFAVLYFYTIATLLLGFALMQYFLRYGLQSSTYEVCCRRNNSGRNASLSGRCARYCSMSELMTLAHRFVDPMSPAGYRGSETISPVLRFRVNCLLPLPFIYFSFHTIATSTYSLEIVYHLLSVTCALMAVFYMRRVVIGTYSYDNTGHYCLMCNGVWSGQDHHCGAFGTCIHDHNRSDYIRFALFGAAAVGMLFPYGALYLYRNWIWSGSWLSLRTWFTFARHAVLPLIVFNMVSMLPMFLFGCAAQQYIYLLIVDAARYEKVYSKWALLFKDALADEKISGDSRERVVAARASAMS